MRGGVTRRADLPVTRQELNAAVRQGAVRRVTRGLYALHESEEALLLARTLCGARSHRTAAMVHGFAVLTPPPLPEIAVPRGRPISAEVRRHAIVCTRSLSKEERFGAVTSPLVTVVSCLRDLGGVEGLVVADSATRSGQVTAEEVNAALEREHGQGVRAARGLARHIDPGAESALESVLRWVAKDIPPLNLRTQVAVGGRGWTARVDLADPDLGIIAEADSFAWHGSRSALARDARRYDHMAAAGWRVLRFTYEAVLFDHDWVRAQLADATAVQQRMLAAGVCPWRSGAWSVTPVA